MATGYVWGEGGGGKVVLPPTPTLLIFESYAPKALPYCSKYITVKHVKLG